MKRKIPFLHWDSLPSFIIFLISLPLHKLDSAQFTVLGPATPITAIVGEDIVLPCYLSPRMSAENMEVTWSRPQVLSAGHLYHDGKDHTEFQMPQDQGRTEFLKENIANGSVALRIRNVRPSDEGQYECFFQSSTFYAGATLELKIAGLGSNPHISIEDYQDGGIQVVCQSTGWYPEPEVLWRDATGKHLQSLSVRKSEVENGLFEIQASIIIAQHTNQKLSSCIQNRQTNHEKESTVYISDIFFPRMNPWILALSLILGLLFLFIGLTVHLFKRKGKLTAEIGKLTAEIGWRQCTLPITQENVTLDPDTAHPILTLSKDQKSVRWADKQQDLPDNPERFDTWRCVLGCEEFTSGRHYWEVEVEGKGDWVVEVARRSMKRKGEIIFNPEEGIWAVQMWGGQYRACTSPLSPLTLREVPRKIRVYLDYEGEEVTFFDADKGTKKIFTFPQTSFSGERICPWLGMGAGLRLTLHP
ncbi:butyrophilin subfamily 1 member A1 isoform X1 [Alligator mississippiensis]|uniref:butyrophilin subfamily 1 member A1 isoform X1 n=1 Tax=Alligator mississippiensis TaxID=8496 RepID=UPI002877859A|nr:butyrophilin subfamily 1 member A1 isoform X1 [Alligator mississippiensis]